METVQLNIDHIGLAARDMTLLRGDFLKLGFRITEPEPLIGTNALGEPEPLGQESAHFMFSSAYVELSAVTGERPDNHLEPRLQQYQGLHILALASDDIDADVNALANQGIEVSSVREANRTIRYGAGGTARFRWAAVTAEAFPEGFLCLVEQQTPSLVFQTSMTAHENGIVDLLAVHAIAADPVSVARRYAALEKPESLRQLLIMTRQEATERFCAAALPHRDRWLAGFTLGSDDLDRTRSVLQKAAVPFDEVEGRLVISPKVAAGAMIAIEPVP